MLHYSLLHALLICITCRGDGWRAVARRYNASSWWIIWRAFYIILQAAEEGCSSEPKLFPYYRIMCKQITLHHVERRARAQVHITSIFITYIWHFMTCTGSEGCRTVIYHSVLKDCWWNNLHVNPLGWMETRWGREKKGNKQKGLELN